MSNEAEGAGAARGVLQKAVSLLRSGDIGGLCRAVKRRISDRQAGTVARWYRDGAEHRLRLDYPLTAESVVFDVGGYLGNWTAAIVSRYDCYVHVFEPVPEFCKVLVEKFRSNPKVRVNPFGLSDRDSVAEMSVLADGSTIYKEGHSRVTIQLRDIWGFLREAGLDRIDLVKINIEGGEYALLRRMLEKQIVPHCQDIQIQFHSFVPGAKRLRSQIRSALQATHFLTYDYPFVWENWRKRPADCKPPASF